MNEEEVKASDNNAIPQLDNYDQRDSMRPVPNETDRVQENNMQLINVSSVMPDEMAPNRIANGSPQQIIVQPQQSVGNLLRFYNSQMPQPAATNLLKNPLVKNKGQIMDDWSMPDETYPIGGNQRKLPFGTLSNERGIACKTKTQVQQLNYSSFNQNPQNAQQDSSKHMIQVENQMLAIPDDNPVSRDQLELKTGQKEEIGQIAAGGQQQKRPPTTQYKVSDQHLNGMRVGLSIEHATNQNKLSAEPVPTGKMIASMHLTPHNKTTNPSQRMPTQGRVILPMSQTPQLRKRKPKFNDQAVGIVDGVAMTYKQEIVSRPVSKISDFILQLYNRIVPSGSENSNNNSSDDSPSSGIKDNSNPDDPREEKKVNMSSLKKSDEKSSKGKKRVRIQDDISQFSPDPQEEEKVGGFAEPEEDDENLNEEEKKYKKWMTEKNVATRKSVLIPKAGGLVKIKTHKEIYYVDDKDKLAASKSYIYMVKGLSDELSDDVGSLHNNNKNYRSAFFESDKDLEDYHRQLKDALQVQFQKEVNLGTHIEIKTKYEQWVINFQTVYQKSSPHKKTLVFDLDETLVRAQRDNPLEGYDARVNVQGSSFIYVKLRPYLIKALKVLRKHYEMVLFTAASAPYAELVLQSFDGHQYFDHILSRLQCLHIYQKAVFIKDLSILLGKRVLGDIIIVDNKIESYSSNLENGVPIVSYYGQEGDIMLKKLARYLLKLKDAEDVRDNIARDFYLQELARMQRSNISRIFELQEIKASILQAMESQHSKKLEMVQHPSNYEMDDEPQQEQDEDADDEGEERKQPQENEQMVEEEKQQKQNADVVRPEVKGSDQTIHRVLDDEAAQFQMFPAQEGRNHASLIQDSSEEYKADHL